MDKNKAWENFVATGKVEDYLKYKGVISAENSPAVNNTNADEKDKNRRTDYKTTEYR